LTRHDCARRLEEAPWLLPVAWAVARGVPCDHAVLAEEIGVPARLARSLVYYARRRGLCTPCPSVRVRRLEREYAAETGGYILYAVVKKRRVAGYAISKSGVEGERYGRLLGRALVVLELSPD